VPWPPPPQVVKPDPPPHVAEDDHGNDHVGDQAANQAEQVRNDPDELSERDLPRTEDPQQPHQDHPYREQVKSVPPRSP
jgi:hypothetical protein